MQKHIHTNTHTHARTHTRTNTCSRRLYGHTRTHTDLHSHTPKHTGTHSRTSHWLARMRWCAHAQIITQMHTHPHTRTRAHAAYTNGSRCRGRRETPLHLAANNGYPAVAAALLAHGANVHAKNNGGCGGRSLFRAMVGVRRAAVADQDGIDAFRSGCTHTHAEARTHTHAHARTHRSTHARTDAHTHAQARTQRLVHLEFACDLARIRVRPRRGNRTLSHANEFIPLHWRTHTVAHTLI
jgi:hypothetical protein